MAPKLRLHAPRASATLSAICLDVDLLAARSTRICRSRCERARARPAAGARLPAESSVACAASEHAREASARPTGVGAQFYSASEVAENA